MLKNWSLLVAATFIVTAIVLVGCDASVSKTHEKASSYRYFNKVENEFEVLDSVFFVASDNSVKAACIFAGDQAETLRQVKFEMQENKYSVWVDDERFRQGNQESAVLISDFGQGTEEIRVRESELGLLKDLVEQKKTQQVIDELKKLNEQAATKDASDQ